MTIFPLALTLCLRCTCGVRGISLCYKASTIWLIMVQWHPTFLKCELHLLTLFQVLQPPCLCWGLHSPKMSMKLPMCTVLPLQNSYLPVDKTAKRTITCQGQAATDNASHIRVRALLACCKEDFLNHQRHSWSTLSTPWSMNPSPMRILDMIFCSTNSTPNFISHCSKHMYWILGLR